MALFDVNEKSSIPVWLQLKNRIIYLITSGYYKPGDQLPTVRGLACEAEVNYNTVSKVYMSLEQDGYIESRQRHGAFVLDVSDKPGVTTSETNVINNDKYFMVIPTHANTDLDVTIDYVVITEDANVNGGYVETENIITKKVTIPTLTNNKAYNLKLILGMTSVKLDAEVADWEVDGSTEVNLPRNNE